MDMDRPNRQEWLPDRWTLLGCVIILAVFLGAGLFVRTRTAPVEVGFRAPDFTATDFEGREVSLSQLRGEVVFLNVWATWCPPCREEMPSMQRLYEKLGPEGLRIVAVSIDTPAGSQDRSGRPGGNVGSFVQEHGLMFDVWLDPAGEIQRVYRTLGVPESVIIGRDGSIAKKVIGSTNWDTEENIALIRQLLRS
ncbi:MAG: redoxin domain-containing protein [Gemmatimonas sp.]|nr:redoxin domain-containing protein [Gemmatimonas sp.]